MTDLTSLWHFNRPKLAQHFAKRLMQHERIAMFGPRQTGKTTLLREEVLPALEKAGLLPIYIECWADKANPLLSINYALKKALDALTLSPGKRGARLAKTPVRKIGALGLSIEVGEVAERQIPDNPYLAFDALLTSLLEAADKHLVLVFDEFQAIAQAKDSDAIAAALRAALTQASSKVGVVFSGSSQHLLLEMFSRAQTPLYNFANTEPYSLLREDFIGHVAKKYVDATQRDFNQAIALRVLESVGHQPAPFLNAVGNAMSRPGWTVEDGLKAMLDPKITNKWSSAWYGLTDLQRFTLHAAHEGLLLTSAQTLSRAALELGQPKVQASSVTRAMDALVDKGLVEREPSSRRYLTSDPVMTAWLNHNKGMSVRMA
jgi:uncharacterized protein